MTSRARRTRHFHLAAGLAAASLTLISVAAHAEPSPTEKAAAEALFQKGVELMAAGKTADACAKFSGSNEIDPALGTMLRLADCYERIDKTASAWALFQQAAATAQSQGQGERVRIANERAKSVEQRLSRLELGVDPEIKSIKAELTLNGVVIPSGTWDAALPVDPGQVTVEAHAEGYEPFKTTLTVAPGPVTVRVTVPALRAAPTVNSAEPAAGAATAAPAPAPEPRSNTGKVVGFTLGGIGVASLAAGGIFAYLANDKNNASLEYCRKGEPNSCTAEGVELRNDAQKFATFATIGSIAGGVLLATGITVLVISPSQREASASVDSFRARAMVTPGGLRVEGEF